MGVCVSKQECSGKSSCAGLSCTVWCRPAFYHRLRWFLGGWGLFVPPEFSRRLATFSVPLLPLHLLLWAERPGGVLLSLNTAGASTEHCASAPLARASVRGAR